MSWRGAFVFRASWCVLCIAACTYATHLHGGHAGLFGFWAGCLAERSVDAFKRWRAGEE